eukprot:CAMPEP_0174931798 /NCGR_PEP_ID=MMETSP1355-20121228/34976_1 /TAXON_ID=464990 /ORGANISM="Hemiselmis tepida, Strain CCMP443" /LENGTH=202 /DNA_ID=CAMNT_0016178181 /DNA_START=8 /DNA_END=616 /DNA_ORIENTATION=+
MASRRPVCVLCIFLILGAGVCAVVGNELQDQVLNACGLPTGYVQTSHCFVDSTHHTCCVLGPEARAYADSSGNPIGTASSKAFFAKHGRMPNATDVTPWCTCFGSLVCGYYADKFPNDGTAIKFIYQPQSDPPQGALNVPSSRHCEAKARDYFEVAAHGTPGVSDPRGSSAQCPNYNVAANVAPLAPLENVGSPSVQRHDLR